MRRLFIACLALIAVGCVDAAGTSTSDTGSADTGRTLDTGTDNTEPDTESRADTRDAGTADVSPYATQACRQEMCGFQELYESNTGRSMETDCEDVDPRGGAGWLEWCFSITESSWPSTCQEHLDRCKSNGDAG